MKAIAIIPARGGSKRIPRKNVRSFRGRPMLAYAIQTAKSTGLFDTVVVSTDDEEIAAVAESAGAWVPFRRPPELADDFTGTTPVVRHAINWLEAADQGAQSYCCLYATVPLLNAHWLAEGYRRLLHDPDVDYAFSVGQYRTPVMRALTEGPQGGVAMLFPQHAQTRSQDLPPVYHDAGQFYWGRRAAWIEGRPLFHQRTSMVVLPAYRVIDIDNEEDWRLAEHYSRIIEEAQLA